MGFFSSAERIFKYPVTFPPRLSSNDVNAKMHAPEQSMKNKDYTMFGRPLVALLIGLISSPAWAAPAGKLVGWGNNQYGQNERAGRQRLRGNRREPRLPQPGAEVQRFAGRLGIELWRPSPWGGRHLPRAGDRAAGNGFKAIAAGAFHSLALKTDGSLVGWGSNEVFGHDANPTGQATVPSGNDFVAIAAGDFRSLALKADGSVVAWGDNSVGQTDTPSGNDFVAITAGDGYNLALKSD